MPAAFFLQEILLPRTDAGTIAQWIVVATSVPTAAVLLRRRGSGDVAVFVSGLGCLALAWFAVRAVH
ncbi:MAG: hypothetical protein WEB06_12885 [Actinomycetota bacterium]